MNTEREEGDIAYELEAIIWYYAIDSADEERALRRRKQLNFTQMNDVIWAYEDHLISSGEF